MEAAELNVELAPSAFTIDLPEGTKIDAHGLGLNIELDRPLSGAEVLPEIRARAGRNAARRGEGEVPKGKPAKER